MRPGMVDRLKSAAVAAGSMVINCASRQIEVVNLMGKSEKVYRIFHVAEGTQCSSQLIGASHTLATSARVVLQHYVVISPWLRFYRQFISWISDTSSSFRVSCPMIHLPNS